MRDMRWMLLLLVLCSIALLAACSDDSGEGDGDETEADVTFATAGEALTIDSSDAKAEFQVIPFWLAEEESMTGYSLSKSEAAKKGRFRQAESFATKRPDWITPARHERIVTRAAWSRKMREAESRILSEGSYSAEQIEQAARLRGKKSAECGATEVVRGGECKNEFGLRFMDFDGEITDLTVRIKGKGEHVAVAVDVDDTVSQADIDEIVSRFDDIVYPRTHFFFGESLIGNVDYVDRDQDGLRLVVLSNLVNDSGAVGLFNPFDFAAGTLNTSDILWVVVPDDDNPMESVLGTVAHEYFHMVLFGVKKAKFKADETVWLNESLAHTAEDLSGFGIDNVDTALAFLENANSVSMAFSGDDIEARGMGFLFVRYLFEQKGGVTYGKNSGSELTDKGGAAFLTSLVHTNKTGFEALNAALKSNWGDSFKHWLAAVALAGRPIANDSRYKYQALYDDPLTGQKIGVCTNCTRKNLDGDDLRFSGFECPAFSDGHEGTLQAVGLDCVAVKGSTVLDTQGDEDGVEFVLVRVK